MAIVDILNPSLEASLKSSVRLRERGRRDRNVELSDAELVRLAHLLLAALEVRDQSDPCAALRARGVDEEGLALLRRGGILIDADDAPEEVVLDGAADLVDAIDRHRVGLGPSLEEARVNLVAQGFAVVRGALPPVALEKVAEHARALFANGYALADGNGEEVGNRLNVIDPPLGSTLRDPICRLVNAVVSSPRSPAWSFLSFYPAGGGALLRHRDNDFLDWKAVLVVDEQGGGDHGWPFEIIDASNELRSVRVEPGDLLVYDGVSSPHGRPPAPEGCATCTLTFGFVAEGQALDYTNEDARFLDGRPRLLLSESSR